MSSPLLKSIFLVLGLIGIFPVSASLAQELAPSEKKMLMLSIGGPRFGPCEICFTPHNMSIKNSLGNSIWSDKEPKMLKVMNLENAFYMKQSVLQYADDRGSLHGGRGPKKISSRELKLKDGHNGVETIAASLSHGGRRYTEQKTLAIVGVKLPEAMLNAWNIIMASPDDKNLVVDLISSKGKDDGIEQAHGVMRHLVEFRSLKAVPLQADRFIIPQKYKETSDMGSFYFSPTGEALKKSDLDDIFRTSPK